MGKQHLEPTCFIKKRPVNFACQQDAVRIRTSDVVLGQTLKRISDRNNECDRK